MAQVKVGDDASRQVAGTLTTPRALAELEQRARALETEISRRTQLERSMLALLEVTGRLAAAHDRESIGRLTVEKGMQAVGAVDAGIWLMSPSKTHLELFAVSSNHTTPEATVRYRVIALPSDTPVAQVIRTGRPLFLGSIADYVAQFPASRERLEDVLTPRQRAFAIVPMAGDDSTFGCIVFTFDTEREFTGPDRAFKTILARQCALALERIQNQEQERSLRKAAEHAAAAEKAARNETELLYDLIATVNELDDPASVYELALQTVRRGARADRAAILLFDDAGMMRVAAAQNVPQTCRRAIDGYSPWQRATAAATPIVVHNTELDPAWDQFRAEGIRVLAFVPIVHARQSIGAVMLARDESRRFDVRDLQFTATVAVHVAQSVQRKRNELELARLYREERDARVHADESTRAREEILSVVSHDLRNPLGTILMNSTSLLKMELGDRSHRVRALGERIHRQAQRMARSIEDLVDFAGIQAGQLTIERKPHRPEDLLSATSDIFASIAQERGLRFDSAAAPSLPAIECDLERAIQVMSNLVANALKVTPRGGAIAIGAELTANEVAFSVRDTGPGITDDELPHLFERYWRSKHSHYKGAGLGLSIARGIVDAHGGRIWVETQLGAGTTFYFSLEPPKSP